VNSAEYYQQALLTCRSHARRLRWACEQLHPFTKEDIAHLNDSDIAVIDQLFSRFAQLQDVMGRRLFPAILQLTKEPMEDAAFIDKLNQLEKLGVINATSDWLNLREVRNTFVHEYPEDPALQAEAINTAVTLTDRLLAMLDDADRFAQKYV